MEEEIRLLRGEWPSVWPETGWKNWKQRLEIACTKVIAEQKLITDAANIRWEKFQSEKAKIAEQQEKLRLSFLSSRTSPELPTLLLSSSWTRTQ